MCVGNEEEEESLKSFYAYESSDITAAIDEKEKEKEKVGEGQQSAPDDVSDDSFIAESQASPKCSAVLRNKVTLYHLLMNIINTILSPNDNTMRRNIYRKCEQ